MTDPIFKQIDEVLKAAKINMCEAGKIFPVSRQTMYLWRARDTIGNQHLWSTTKGIAAVIKRATDLKLLPVPQTIPLGVLRLNAIKAALVTARNA